MNVIDLDEWIALAAIFITLEERLAGKISIIHEFIDKKTGWCRSRFIPVDYDENGRLLHVCFVLSVSKKRKNVRTA